ncbi:hypothetical protein [Mycobacterium sp. URHB0021]
MVSGSAVDTGVATTRSITVDCWFTEAELADAVRLVRALLGEFGDVCESRCGSTFVVDSGATSADSTGGVAAGCGVGIAAVGGSSGEAAETAEGSSVPLGVGSADAVVSLLDGAEAVSAPPELCTIPERGSAVET